jgi:hypothetical protein
MQCVDLSHLFDIIPLAAPVGIVYILHTPTKNTQDGELTVGRLLCPAGEETDKGNRRRLDNATGFDSIELHITASQEPV